MTVWLGAASEVSRVRIYILDRIGQKPRIRRALHIYEASALLNESANRVGEYPCSSMCSTKRSRTEKFSGVMPCIFHLDILRGKDCR